MAGGDADDGPRGGFGAAACVEHATRRGCEAVVAGGSEGALEVDEEVGGAFGVDAEAAVVVEGDDGEVRDVGAGGVVAVALCLGAGGEGAAAICGDVAGGVGFGHGEVDERGGGAGLAGGDAHDGAGGGFGAAARVEDPCRGKCGEAVGGRGRERALEIGDDVDRLFVDDARGAVGVEGHDSEVRDARVARVVPVGSGLRSGREGAAPVGGDVAGADAFGHREVQQRGANAGLSSGQCRPCERVERETRRRLGERRGGARVGQRCAHVVRADDLARDIRPEPSHGPVVVRDHEVVGARTDRDGRSGDRHGARCRRSRPEAVGSAELAQLVLAPAERGAVGA